MEREVREELRGRGASGVKESRGRKYRAEDEGRSEDNGRRYTKEQSEGKK